MNKVSTYFLRFDFSKKQIVFYGVVVFIVFFLLCSIVWTYYGLTNLLENQSIGLKYQQKIMDVYHLTVNLQLNKEEDLKNSLIIEMQNLLSWIDSLKIKAENDQSLEQWVSYREKFNVFLLKLQEQEWRTQIPLMKNTLLFFSKYISRLFHLKFHFNTTIGIQLDFVLKRLPYFQNYLSEQFSPVKTNMTKLFLQATLDQIHDQAQLLIESGHGTSLLTQFLASSMNLFKTLGLDFENEGKDVLKQSMALSHEFFDNLQNEIFKEIHSNIYKQLISVFLLVFGGITIIIPLLTNTFRNPLIQIKEAAESLSNGNLAVRISIDEKRKDESVAISQSFNDSAEIFEKMMIETDHFATNLSKHSSEIFCSAQQQEQALTEQEKTIQEITQNSKKIAETVEKFSQKLDMVNENIETTTSHVRITREGLNSLALIIQQMASSAKNTVASMSSIKAEVDKVAQVIQTLVVIADQINLLSLNTAIRADKVGVKKTGFTVIASKIKDLADRTAYATLDMEQIVMEMHEMLPQVLFDIAQLSQEIQQVSDDSSAMEQQLQKLLALIQSHIVTFHAINVGMQNQADKTSEIEGAVVDLTQSTKITNETIRHLYTEIESMHQSTETLYGITKKYTQHSEK